MTGKKSKDWTVGCAEVGKKAAENMDSIQLDHNRAAFALIYDFIYRELVARDRVVG